MAREKAKDPSEMSIESKLKNLYDLQTTLSDIDKIKTLRGELPLEVQDLEDEIEGLTTRVERMRNQVEELQREVSGRRINIEKNNSDIARYKEQLNNVRNNREYDSLTKEIEYSELDNQLNDKKIREALENIERITREADSYTLQIGDRREDLNLKKNELEDIITETRAEEEKLREKAKSIELCIEPRLLNAFKRIRKNARNGLGVVYVQRDACGGCFNKIPPQRQLDVRLHKKIIVCEYCGRILIDPELAGVQLDKPAEEKTTKRRRSVRAKKEAE